MAVYTKIGLDEINLIEKNFSIGKILNYSGIKKGIENTNYLIKSKKRKFILTIFEKRVNSRDLPFFMKLMSGLAKSKINCPKPLLMIKLRAFQHLDVCQHLQSINSYIFQIDYEI